MSGRVWHNTLCISRLKSYTSVWRYIRSSVTQHALYISTKGWHRFDDTSGREWLSTPCIPILAASKPTSWAVHLSGPTDATASNFEAWSEYSSSCFTHCLDVCLFNFRLPGSLYFIFPWSSSQHKATCVITFNHILPVVWWTVFLWWTVANDYAVNVKRYSILPDSVCNQFYIKLINADYDITWQWV